MTRAPPALTFRRCAPTSTPCTARADDLRRCASSVMERTSAGAGQVECRDVAEGHRGPDRRARAGVAVAHDGRARVAGRVEAGDRGAVLAQHPGPLVGAQPALGAEVAGHDLDGVE